MRKFGVLGRLLLAVAVAGLGCRPDPPPPPTGPFPFVLAHGALGMESYGPLDYWFGIVSAMEAEGAQVFVTEVSALNSSYVRGAQSLDQIQTILATTGAAKVHIIGHSQGGLDARYVAGMRPDLVASVTTIGTPNQGAAAASFLFDGILPDGSFTSGLLNFFGASLSLVLELFTGTTNPIDARAALEFLTPTEIAGFNALFPGGLPSGCGPGPSQSGGVLYYSWTGDTPLTNIFDPTDNLIGITSLIYLGQANDGLVSVCSSQLGDVIADDYRMNHLDEVNQILGAVHLFETNPKTLFRNHVNRIQALGL